MPHLPQELLVQQRNKPGTDDCGVRQHMTRVKRNRKKTDLRESFHGVGGRGGCKVPPGLRVHTHRWTASHLV